MEDLQEIEHKAFDLENMQECLSRWPHCRATREPETAGERGCLSCAYFIPMIGVFADQAGACTNQRSPCDGRLTARQDGCEEHVPSHSILRFSITYPRPEEEQPDLPPDDWEPKS